MDFPGHPLVRNHIQLGDRCESRQNHGRPGSRQSLHPEGIGAPTGEVDSGHRASQGSPGRADTPDEGSAAHCLRASMSVHRFLNPAFPGYESVPARLMADISILPCDLYVWRGPRPAPYAMRDGDPGKVIARAERGLPFLIREIDADLLRGALAASLPRVLGNQRISPIERSKTAYLIAAR